ncbi:MAG: peptidylprolyl isomerase [Planctomycetes bacterium]|nr:peptidylprolyl isomerase [Planctomycetota bacterium]
MGERIHSTHPATRAPSRRLIPFFAFGAIVVTAAGVLFYDPWPSQQAQAQTEKRGRSQQRRRAQNTPRRPQTKAPARTAVRSGNGSPRSTASRAASVAKVNGQSIARAELVEACLRRYGQNVLEELINKRIIEQQCAQRQVQVTQQDIDVELEAMSKRAGMPRDELLKLYEQERGVDPNTLIADIIWPRLALQKLAGTGVEISERELLESFEANYGERVKARMIMLNNHRKALEIWEKANVSLQQGDSKQFERLAKEFSVDPASRPLGGLIQPIHRFSGMQGLEEEAFSLNSGELSKVIQVGTYYVILLCEGRTDPVDVSLEDKVPSTGQTIREQLHADIYSKRVEQAALKLFTQLKENSSIENLLPGSNRTQVSAQGAPSRGGTATAADPLLRQSRKNGAVGNKASRKRTR